MENQKALTANSRGHIALLTETRRLNGQETFWTVTCYNTGTGQKSTSQNFNIQWAAEQYQEEFNNL